MKEQLKDLVERAKQEANLIKNENDFLNIKSKYLGKKSELANYMSEIKNMSVEDKKEYGPLFNKIKKDFEELFATKLDEASNSKEILTFDPTIPCKCKHGSLHPVTLVGREVSNILKNFDSSMTINDTTITNNNNTPTIIIIIIELSSILILLSYYI